MKFKPGIGWYRADQYDLLYTHSVDRNEMFETFKEWEKSAKKSLKGLRAIDQAACKVPIDVLELICWCQCTGRVLDGQARSAFIHKKIEEMFK